MRYKCADSVSITNQSVTCRASTGSPGRHLTRFSSPDVSNTTTLLLSEDGDTLYVGARDAVLALDVSLKEAIILRSKVGERALLEVQAQPV